MIMKFYLEKIMAFLRSLRSNRNGAVAIETAICIPILFLLMAIGAELVRYVNVVDSVARATATTADMLAREDSVNAGKLEKYLELGPKIISEEGYGPQTDIALRSISRDLDGAYIENWIYSELSDDNVACTRLTLNQLRAEGFTLEPGRNAIIAEQCHKLQLNFPGANILIVGQILSDGIYSRAIFQTRYKSLTEDPNG